MEFTANCQNIMECGMENIRSLKVECGAYVSRQIFLSFSIFSLHSEQFKKCAGFIFLCFLSLLISLSACSWVGYEHSSFCGQQFVLEKGDYPRFEAYSGSNSYRIERMISFRPICCAVGFTCNRVTALCSPYAKLKLCSGSFLLLCTEPQGLPHDRLREREHDGSSVRAV